MKKIEDIEKLILMEQKLLELEIKIEKLSIYEPMKIGNIIAKLMTAFEGVEYKCVKKDDYFSDSNYCIEKEIDEFPNIRYRLGNLGNMRHSDYLIHFKENDLCFLPPSNYVKSTIKNMRNQFNNIDYVQNFIDYLYVERSSKELDTISNDELEVILNQYLKMTQKEQLQRKEEIKIKVEEKIKKEKIMEFENSCLIDRKLIYNIITYIINNYEENMIAIQEHEQEWKRTSQWSELSGYHKLTIKSENDVVSFRTLVDSKGSYPDEEDCVSSKYFINKDTEICFFELKRALMSIIKNTTYANRFMEMISQKYLEKKVLTSDDLQLLLIQISNEKKENQRILKKEL